MNTDDLKSLFKKQNYILGYECSSTDELVFVRKRADFHNLFERVVINVSKMPPSPKWDWFAVRAEVSVVPGYTAVKGLCEGELIMGLPFIGSRGAAHLPDERTSRLWQSELIHLLPSKREEVFGRYGRKLLESTSELRVVCAKYFEKYVSSPDLDQLKAKLGEKAAKAVKSLPTYPIQTIPDQTCAFQCALALICTFAAEVEERREDIGFSDPFADRELFLRLQYLASRIAGEPGWEL